MLEKARESGAHMLSGAVLDPRALEDLVPDWRERGAPLDTAVRDDRIYFLTRNRALRFPITPPPLRNHGHYVISLNRFMKWLGALVEEAGVDVFAGFAGSEVLLDGDRVVGVRTGDQGVDRGGARKPTFEPGVDIRAGVTIFADGVRGNLTKTVVRRFALDEGRLPQVYALGVKELWEVPADRMAPGSVIHTMGFPLRLEEFGAASSTRCRKGALRSGSWPASTTATRSSIRTPRSSGSSCTRWWPACWRTDRWCATAPRRCPRAAGTRCRAATCPAR